MIHESSTTAVAIFSLFVGSVLALSFYLGGKAKSAAGYYAAHGEIHWFINGIAFAGDYLSAASFLGICGMIAFYGYDGFLYSIGYLAGWVVALFVVAEPLKRMGRFTFADALDSKFNSRGIKLSAAISTLVVSIFYLIPQMVGAGVLIQPLLGFSHYVGVISVGVVVMMIVVTAGMVSTTYVQFIKGSLLVFFCAILTVMILNRGLIVDPGDGSTKTAAFKPIAAEEATKAPGRVLPEEEGWKGKPYVRVENAGRVLVYRKANESGSQLVPTQTMLVKKNGAKFANGLPFGRSTDSEATLLPIGQVSKLPGDKKETGPLDPLQYFDVLQNSEVVLWSSEKIVDAGGITTVYYPKPTPGANLLVPGNSPTFAGIRGDNLLSKIDFLSLMLALFAGTASLPHILIRYYTVKDQAAARKSTVVGIASIGFFYILTLYLGLAAMTSGALDVSSSNMAAPLLARAYGELPFAIISAIAFTTVLGTVSGLIMAASGAVAHDLLVNSFGMKLDDHGKVRAGKISALVVGVIAIILGIIFEKMNVAFLVAWAFNVAASANLPSLVMLLFWPKTTKQGITAAIVAGMVSSLAWILLSEQAYKDVYGWAPSGALAPFSQPAIVTIPLGFLVLVVVSLITQPKNKLA